MILITLFIYISNHTDGRKKNWLAHKHNIFIDKHLQLPLYFKHSEIVLCLRQFICFFIYTLYNPKSRNSGYFKNGKKHRKTSQLCAFFIYTSNSTGEWEKWSANNCFYK